MKKLQAIIFVCLVLFIILGLHEFSHALVATLFGYPVYSISIGLPLPPVLTISQSYGPEITLSPWLFTVGVEMPNSLGLPLVPALLIILAGPISNILLCLVCAYLDGSSDLHDSEEDETESDPPEGLVGPIGIVKHLYNQYQKRGVKSVFRLTGTLSLGMGILNLIPFPPLDGGRALERIILALSGNSQSVYRGLDGVTAIGALLLMLLFFIISFRDVFRRRS